MTLGPPDGLVSHVRAAAGEHLGRRPRRLFHGRGHRFPGYEAVTVDAYPPLLLVTIWDAASDEWQQDVADALAPLVPDGGVMVQHRQRRSAPARVLAGRCPEPLVVEEEGLRYLVKAGRNQNPGLFLDMAPLRAWVRERCADARVLNLFAYTCAFSVAALDGGASRVVNIDMSRPALDWGMENHALNDQDTSGVTMLPHNLFRSWWKLKQLGPHDIVIIDPPTLQRGSFNAEKHYGNVLKKLPELCAPGAEVLACLNSPFLPHHFVTDQMARWCPSCQFVEWLPVAEGFEDAFPERGLKIGLFRYAGRAGGR